MQKIRKYILLTLILVFALSLIGCSSKDVSQGSPLPEDQTPEPAEHQEPIEEPQREEPLVDPASVNANEAGQIMILEWHVIGEKEGRWARTYTNFRKDLETLYEKGYRLVSLRDVVTNNIQVEAGILL